MAASPAFAGPVLPKGGSVAAGSASIGAPTNNSLTVSQSSQRAIINWGSFSIGAGGTVHVWTTAPGELPTLRNAP